MPRLFVTAFALFVLLSGSLCAADAKDKDKKDKDTPKPTAVTITKVDAAKGEITVKLTDAQGKMQEKTFRLSEDIRYLDEMGHAVKIDVFQAGHDALVLESEGKLRELRRAIRPHQGRRLSDALKVLIEMTDCEEGCTEEVQRMYDILRQLDTAKNGKIDPAALKAAREKLVEERVDDLFKRLDANKDGKISQEEAKGWLKEHFEKLDTNKDGFIDRAELLKAAQEKAETKPATTDIKPAQPEKK